MRKPDLKRAAQREAPRDAPEGSSRRVYFDGEFHDCPVLARGSLPVGHSIEGPAIVEEYDSTVVIAPGWHAEVDAVASLVMQRAAKGES